MDVPASEGSVYSPIEHLTDCCRRALSIADHEVRRFGHRIIEPAHLLIGVVAVDGAAALVFHDSGHSLAAVCRGVESALGIGDFDWYPPRPVDFNDSQSPRQRFVGYSREARHVLDTSFAEARDVGHVRVTTAHVLSAILADRRDTAYQVVIDLGARPETLRAAVLARYSEEK